MEPQPWPGPRRGRDNRCCCAARHHATDSAQQDIKEPITPLARPTARAEEDSLQGPRVYLPLATPHKALASDASVPYPERALADLALAIQRRNDAAIRALTSVQSWQQVRTGEDGSLRLFDATAGLLVIEGHVTTKTGDHVVMFHFVLPTASGDQEFPGAARVRRGSASGWYVDDVFQGEPETK